MCGGVGGLALGMKTGHPTAGGAYVITKSTPYPTAGGAYDITKSIPLLVRLILRRGDAIRKTVPKKQLLKPSCPLTTQ